MSQRRQSRSVHVGDVLIGGGADIPVQSMTKTPTEDVAATVSQIEELSELGCAIVRVAVPTAKAARCLGDVKKHSSLPVVADVHFDHSLALTAIEQGADKIRINPGNMRSEEGVRDVVRAARDAGIPIRVGVNSGSIRPRDDDTSDLVDLMVEAVLRYCESFEELGFRDIVISLKASNVLQTLRAYREVAGRCDYPLHLGVTAAGPPDTAIVRSAIGIGALLAEGIGDTIRVSFTGPPHAEVEVGYQILEALGLAERGPQIMSCPTCGRCQIDLCRIVNEVRQRLPRDRVGLRVAIMGCIVNGPGEAREADIGLAGGKGFAFLFRDGEKLRKVREDTMVDELLREIESMPAASSKGSESE